MRFISCSLVTLGSLYTFILVSKEAGLYDSVEQYNYFGFLADRGSAGGQSSMSR